MSSSPQLPTVNRSKTITPANPAMLMALAAAFSFVSLPLLAQSSSDALGAQPSQSNVSNAPQTETDIEAAANSTADYVPAQAILTNTLDARKMQPGANFEAKLDGKVQLANGPELPAGTILRGVVAQDDMNIQGNAKLVLRFNTAQLKDGKTIPVHATIVGFEAPADQDALGYTGNTAPKPNDWRPATQQVDQIGVTSGVDLHSSLGSQNSGVFVATDKDNVKLPRNSAVNLAIASQNVQQASR